MQQNHEAIDALCVNVRGLADGGVILAGKKFQQLLKCLAYYDTFSQVISEIVGNFSYDEQLERASFFSDGRYYFRMPPEPHNIVALAICLFMDFDAGDIDLIDFITNYFPSASTGDSFDKFVDKVVVPFRDNLVMLVQSGYTSHTPHVVPTAPHALDFVSDNLENDLAAYVADLRSRIGLIKDDDSRAAATELVDAFSDALGKRDKSLIRTCWLGIRATLKSMHINFADASKIEALLKEYSVIK